MRNPGGYAYIVNGGKDHIARFDGAGKNGQDRFICEGVNEVDTFTCKHCNSIVHVFPKMDPAEIGGLCKQCMGMICPKCLGKGCTPWEKQMEIAEARGAALRSYGF